MYAREFHDGAKDGLEALESLDPEKITSFSDLLQAMGKTAFGGRHLGVTPKDGGQFAEVLSDATVVWPLLMMGILERKKTGAVHQP